MIFSKLGTVSDASVFSTKSKKRVKLTVHRTGRAGFSREAARVLSIEDGMAMLVAVNGADWFVKFLRNDPRGFKLRCASSYYSADMREFLTSIGVDYADQSHTTIYDISRYGVDDEDGLTIWKFVKRVIDVVHRENEKADKQAN